MIIYYNNWVEPHSHVKIKLSKEAESIEFEVFFARLNYTTFGQDVTINWKSLDLDNNDTFYTDANAYKIVKRVKNM